MLIILTGKTASGKDTIKSALLKKYPNLKKIITTTSRALRQNEIRGADPDNIGADHHFLTRDEFESKIKAGEFAEYVQYGGNLYGTQKKDLEQAKTNDALWRIDPSRAGEVRNFINRTFAPDIADDLIKRVVVIYINAPEGVILQRLRDRGLSEIEIRKRMNDDERIWNQYKNSYDFVIDNIPGKLEHTINQVFQILQSREASFSKQ